MTRRQQSRLALLLARISAERALQTVSAWCEANIVFSEPDCRGAFSLAGREYLREPLDNWGAEGVPDQVCVMAPRTGKTRILYGGIGWTIKHAPARVLYVKPKTKGAAGAEDDARTRFIPMLRSSPALAELIPSGGQKRHEFKTPQQIIGGAIVDWTGSNSVAALASNPCRVVVQDEVEKFNATRKRDEEGNVVEADASALADERCKEFANPKRFKASTPTIVSGKIWQELTQKSDFRRYFVPCPHCAQAVLLAWSKEFSLLPTVGCEAYVKWDPAAKVGGVWDDALVEASAHYACPHCQGQIRDEHKPAMIAAGEWRPTRTGAPGYRGYYLPAMYALHAQCSVGKMASRFLAAVHSLEGPRSFINNDLAEPYGQQGVGSKRVEALASVEVGAEWKLLMTVDCQQKAPHFWHIVRAYGGREIIGASGGPLETWDDVRAAQERAKVKDVGVIIDSGYGAKDDAEVYRNCAAHGELLPFQTTHRDLHVGWLPAKGMPGRRRWRDQATGLFVPWFNRPTDPYMGTLNAGQVTLEVFEFARDAFNDILERLRYNKAGDFHWTISKELDTDEYHLHMRGQVKREVVKGGRLVIEWQKRYSHAPDHLRSCEIMQVAGAMAMGLLDINLVETRKEQTK